MLLSSLLFLEIYYNYKFEQRSEQGFEKAVAESESIMQASLRANHEKIALTALYLSKNDFIKQALVQKNPDLLKFDSDLLKHDEFGSLGKVLVHVLDEKGVSFYRSWSNLTGDNMLEISQDLTQFYQNPKITHVLSPGIYSLTLKTIIPIYDNQKFIGAFQVKGLLDGLALDMKRADIQSLILLDKRFRKQMINQSESVYINNQLVINGEVELIRYYLQNNLQTRAENAAYVLDNDSGQFISIYRFVDKSNQPLAKIVMFRPLTPILAQNMPMIGVFYGLIFGTFGLFWMLLIFYVYYRKMRDKDDEILTMQTAVKKLDFKMSNLGRFWQTVIDRLNDSVLVVNRGQETMLMNGTASRLMELRKFKDRDCAKCSYMFYSNKLKCPEHIEQCSIRESFNLKKPISIVEEITVDRDKRFYEFKATPSLDSRNNVVQVVEVGHDITSFVRAKKQLEEQKSRLNKMAFYDSLTNLPNRRLFSDRLQQAMNLSQRNGKGVALMFMDLDFFKQVNDTHGHETGDKILIECSKRLKSSIRKIDTVSRLGGDEFTIIIEQFENRNAVVDIVQNILNVISKPFHVDGKDFYMTTSIGISIYPGDGDTMTDLIKNADIAMYQAKELGRNSYSFYNQEMTKKAIDRINLEHQLRVAIEQKQFEVHYQPQYHLETGEICGFEALVRWRHPVEGLLLPFVYIELAEETGMIIDIGEQVIEQAMDAITKWHNSGLTNQRMAINISAMQFTNEKLLKTIENSLKKTQCRPEWIELEITETAVMKDIIYADTVLAKLKEMGISIAIDDFGTGYSSLVQLRRLPIDKIKIDQSFIYHLPESTEDLEITKTIINMAHGLKVATIAEGIESHQQSECIQSFGCLHAQGFLFSHPQPMSKIQKLLSEEATSADSVLN